MAYSERELLARIIQCEAGGEGDNGMKAVATFIMNRVNTPERRIFKNFFSEEIYEISYFNKDNLIVQLKH